MIDLLIDLATSFFDDGWDGGDGDLRPPSNDDGGPDPIGIPMS